MGHEAEDGYMTKLSFSIVAALGVFVALGIGCSNENGVAGGTGGSSGAGNATGGRAGSAGTTSGVCDPDPLRTGETTPPGVDAYDCAILDATAKYGEPDAMIFKAIIYAESRFAFDATACTNLPCGTPSGWTAAESQCFGLMQIVLACTGWPNNGGLLPNGHPNLTTDTTSPDWPTSIYNPSINIDLGVWGVSDNRRQVKEEFPGCTEDQYTLMAIGNYNQYGSTQSCTVYNTDYDNALVTYRQYSQAAGWPAHAY
jgi:hypothetical protein